MTGSSVPVTQAEGTLGGDPHVADVCVLCACRIFAPNAVLGIPAGRCSNGVIPIAGLQSFEGRHSTGGWLGLVALGGTGFESTGGSFVVSVGGDGDLVADVVLGKDPFKEVFLLREAVHRLVVESSAAVGPQNCVEEACNYTEFGLEVLGRRNPFIFDQAPEY